MTKEQATALLERYRAGACTEEEKRAVEFWYTKLEKESDWDWSEKDSKMYAASLRKRVFENIEKEKNPIIPISRKRIAWTIAASITAITLSTIIYFAISVSKKKQTSTHTVSEVKKKQDKDVLPGKTGAILTLGNGEEVLLDNTKGGQVATQGNTNILNKNGKLEYTVAEKERGIDNIVFNTVHTPKGREYALVLSDGTKVWLNSASSVHYPVKFFAKERVIEMSGEAYIEVASKLNDNGGKIPFRVHIKHDDGRIEEIRVLGTHFNINAYDDEPVTTVTLLEGSIEIAKKGSPSVKIAPGGQAQIAENIRVQKDADIETAMAWKNGRFFFRKANIQTIMRQAARWYDIEVNYPGKIPEDILTGGLSKNVSLSEFLKILEYSEINATIYDKRVDIKPARPGSP